MYVCRYICLTSASQPAIHPYIIIPLLAIPCIYPFITLLKKKKNIHNCPHHPSSPRHKNTPPPSPSPSKTNKTLATTRLQLSTKTPLQVIKKAKGKRRKVSIKVCRLAGRFEGREGRLNENCRPG